MSVNIAIEHPQTHLLQLPVELRLRIFFYALGDPNKENDLPDPYGPDRPWIHCVVPEERGSTPAVYYAYWGTELMSRLLRINKQTHEEVKKVLYTEFRFVIVGFVGYADALLDRLSLRATMLLRHIFVGTMIDTRYERRLRRMGDKDTREFQTLAARLPGLSSVWMRVRFVGYPLEEKVELVERIMKLLYIFRNVQELKLLGSAEPTGLYERTDVIKACQERLAARLWCE